MIRKIPKKGKITSFVFFVFFVFFSCVSVSEAIIQAGELTLDVTPDNPGPRKEVILKVEYSGVDLNRSEISWFVNGSLQKKGVGEKQFSFVTGVLGTVDLVEVQVVTSAGRTMTQNITIAPAEVDMLWEADSSAPPFYRGKSLNSHRSIVKIVAFPNFIESKGNRLDSKDLVYEWRRNFEIVGGSGGVGKNVFILDQSKFFRKNVITVKVTDSEGILKAQKNASFTNQDPKIIFYEKDPLFGIVYEKAIVGDFVLNKEEVSLVAEPFFFSSDDIVNNNILYKWMLNGKKIESSEGFVKEITLKRQSDLDNGISLVRAVFQNNKRVLQQASSDLKISFDKENKTF